MYKYRTSTCNKLKAKNATEVGNRQDIVWLSDPIAASRWVQNSIYS